MNYQEKVSTRADVRALYQRVIANPAIRQYRGYTESKSYGWDEEKEDYIKCDGEVWFESPAYDATFVPEGECGGDGAELLDEQLCECREQIAQMEDEISDLESEREELEQCMTALEERIKAVEGERDDAKTALLELRRALLLVAELAGARKTEN